jgi:hypothetical protein
VTVQFYAVGGTISEDSAKFVTVAGDPVMGNTLLNAMKVKCGRGLAPDSAGSVTDTEADTLQSGASPLPHLISIRLKIVSDAEGLNGSVELPT